MSTNILWIILHKNNLFIIWYGKNFYEITFQADLIQLRDDIKCILMVCLHYLSLFLYAQRIQDFSTHILSSGSIDFGLPHQIAVRISFSIYINIKIFIAYVCLKAMF